MKRKNGTGSVYKLSGHRRNPYAARITTGYKLDKDNQKYQPIYKFIGFYPSQDVALRALMDYNRQPYNISNITFGEMYEKWYEYKESEGISPKTLRKYRESKKYYEPIWKEKLKDLNLVKLQLFADNLEVTKSILVNIRCGLNQSINYAVKRGYMSQLEANCTQYIDWLAKKETSKIGHTVFSRAERELLWEHKEDPTIRTILVYIYTGLRFSELKGLKEEDCHENYIEIKKSKTEAGEREVPLCDKVLELLPIARVPSYHTFREQFKIATGQLGMNHTVHDTRHTFISMLTEVNVDARVIKQIVGHATSDITESVYTHISMEKCLEEVNKLNCY